MSAKDLRGGRGGRRVGSRDDISKVCQLAQTGRLGGVEKTLASQARDRPVSDVDLIQLSDRS